MILELNIFKVFKKPSIGTEEMQDVNLIEEICKNDDIMSLCISDPLEISLVTDVEFLNKFKLYEAIQFINYMNSTHCIYVAGWIPKNFFLRSYLH